MLPIKSIKAKTVYHILLKSKQKPPTAQKTTERILEDYEIPWDKVYSIPQKVTIESSLRIFQYKILNNILYLNNQLFKMQKVESPLCSLCHNMNETVVHLFSECYITQGIWSVIQTWAINVLKLPELDKHVVIYGIHNSNTDANNQLVNHVVLLFKRFIYNRRSKPYLITPMSFRMYLSYIRDIEKRIAYSSNKTEKHFKKWDPLRAIL